MILLIRFTQKRVDVMKVTIVILVGWIIGEMRVGRICQLTNLGSMSPGPRRMRVETPKASLEIS